MYMTAGMRQRILDRFRRLADIDEIDKAFISYCERVNRHPEFVTTQCCTGHASKGRNASGRTDRGYLSIKGTEAGTKLMMEHIAPALFSAPYVYSVELCFENYVPRFVFWFQPRYFKSFAESMTALIRSV